MNNNISNSAQNNDTDSHDICLYVKKPHYFRETVYYYYYFNDDFNDSPYPWPGQAFTPSMTAWIETDNDIRIVVSDGTMQYPEKGEPGIFAACDQILKIDLEENFSYYPKGDNWIRVDTNSVPVNQDFDISVSWILPEILETVFLDEDNNEMTPKKVVQNRFLDTAYTFSFDSPGHKKIKVAGRSNYGTLVCEKELVMVIENKEIGSKCYANRYDLSLSDYFDLHIKAEPNTEYYLVSQSTSSKIPSASSSTFGDDKVYTISAREIGPYAVEKLILYQINQDGQMVQTGYWINVNISGNRTR